MNAFGCLLASFGECTFKEVVDDEDLLWLVLLPSSSLAWEMREPQDGCFSRVLEDFFLVNPILRAD